MGAGIGGLTAALCFRHLGYRVDVFEQSPELKEVGAGIQISPNALRVFEKLGLDDALKEHGLQAQAIQLMNHAPSRAVARLDLSKSRAQGAITCFIALICCRFWLMPVQMRVFLFTWGNQLMVQHPAAAQF